jgi:hypothetical protein
MKAKRKASDRAGSRALVGYCGLYCGECINYKGEIADQTRDLRKKLREADFSRVAKGLSKFFKEFQDYEKCYAVLGAMVRLRCGRACKKGGGNPYCRVRLCCQKKGIEGCWECVEFETCGKLDFLKPIHADACVKNMRAIRRKGMAGFLKGERLW